MRAGDDYALSVEEMEEGTQRGRERTFAPYPSIWLLRGEVQAILKGPAEPFGAERLWLFLKEGGRFCRGARRLGHGGERPPVLWRI